MMQAVTRVLGSSSRVASATAVILVLAASAWAPLHATATGSDEISWETRQAVYTPVSEWAKKLSEASKNADGKATKQVIVSKNPRKIDETSWAIGAHVNSAEATRQVTERYELTVAKAAGATAYSVADAKVVDTFIGLHRESGAACYPFAGVSLAREGLTIQGGAGELCESFFEGRGSFFAFSASDLKHSYTPPAYVGTVPTGHDFYAVHKILAKDHSSELNFKPAAVFVQCDPESCDELLSGSFSGLNRLAPDARAAAKLEALSGKAWLQNWTDRYLRDLKENPFANFRTPTEPGNRYWSIFVAREVQPPQYILGNSVGLPGSGVALLYNNWAGWEVQFAVWPRRLDVPEQVVGSLYGYFTEETTKRFEPYELERRDDLETRFFEVNSVKGTVELAVVDAETLSGDLEFGLKLKQDLERLPFYMNSFEERSAFGRNRPAPLSVNSIQMNDEELTWVKTGPTSGLIVLPEPLKAGSEIRIRMNYAARSLQKFTHSYSYVDRFAWMPFVSFGDFIDEFEMTIKSPAKNQIIGIGQKIDEKTEGVLAVSRWKAERPVVFPTIIFGRYRSEKPKIVAKGLDGREIPISVHVDEASGADWDITTSSLRKIADEAANSINLYGDISGLEYPYGELNLVNDPVGGFLYGQAPSSLIYLGQGVFKGEASLAPFFINATSISKFLKSVVAHEVGHQWWGSRVSNANTRNYWFVETLAEYFSAIFLEAVYGPKEYQEQVDEWRRNIIESRMKASVQNASTLYAGEDGGYQEAVYNKGPYAFHMLRQTFKGEGPPGPDGADKRFFDALKKMSQDLAARQQIVTMDIQDSLEQALGGVNDQGEPFRVDLSWFFDQWLRGVGIPQFQIKYQTRQSEDRNWIVEGKVEHRIVVGSKRQFSVLEDRFYRGRTAITVTGKDNKEYTINLIVNGKSETPFAFKVPVEPREVAINKYGEMLAIDPPTDAGF